MSTNLAFAPARPVHPDLPERHIEAVPRARRRAKPKVAYVLVIVGGLFAIYLAQLLLSIALSQGAYQISSLQLQQRELSRTQEALSEQLDVLTSPQHLANNALALGMAPGAHPEYLRLSDGSVSAAPGSWVTAACGGSCDLVANSLLAAVPLTAAAAPTTVGTTPHWTTATGATPAINAPLTPPGGLPSLVTH